MWRHNFQNLVSQEHQVRRLVLNRRTNECDREFCKVLHVDPKIKTKIKQKRVQNNDWKRVLMNGRNLVGGKINQFELFLLLLLSYSCLNIYRQVLMEEARGKNNKVKKTTKMLQTNGLQQPSE